MTGQQVLKGAVQTSESGGQNKRGATWLRENHATEPLELPEEKEGAQDSGQRLA